MKKCPCHSEQSYAQCCAPFHERERQAPTPETLIRSRYSAFALGLGEYLFDTLAATHPEKHKPRPQQVAAFSQRHDTQKFAGLRIVYAEANEVLFLARIYVQGADHSFAELSEFAREGEAWKYSAGRLLDKERLPKPLTRETFLRALADRPL